MKGYDFYHVAIAHVQSEISSNNKSSQGSLPAASLSFNLSLLTLAALRLGCDQSLQRAFNRLL